MSHKIGETVPGCKDCPRLLEEARSGRSVAGLERFLAHKYIKHLDYIVSRYPERDQDWARWMYEHHRDNYKKVFEL